jgi:hypothetical protein
MTQLLGLIFISSKIEDALLGSTTGLGRALELCRYHERGGDGKGEPHSDAVVRDSASNYFDALLSAGTIMHALAR